ncbi:MAG: hypothetical protein ABSD85_16525 [Acidimicrobiales bacterium]
MAARGKACFESPEIEGLDSLIRRREQTDKSCVQVVKDITEWFEELDAALDTVLTVIGTSNRSAFELANSQLLAVLVRGQELPPIPDFDAQRHFAAGVARYKDGAETLARTEDVVEVLRAIRAIDASAAEFARMSAAIEKVQGLS